MFLIKRKSGVVGFFFLPLTIIDQIDIGIISIDVSPLLTDGDRMSVKEKKG